MPEMNRYLYISIKSSKNVKKIVSDTGKEKLRVPLRPPR